ncbi:hypothetical protein [Sorangium sp. So ce233]|uniref:hypothetical protein n=1 Tax=Sorangium sp. So ce233 TaxID=3133290 RepID=UPI003F617F15
MDASFLELSFYVGTAGVLPTLEALVTNLSPGSLPRKIRLPNMVGLIEEAEEIEVLGDIIVLRTEGEAFCGSDRTKVARLKKLGRQVYERFVEVADMIPCIYGAILVECSLENPGALRRDPRSLAFCNFFLSKESLAPVAVQQAVVLAGSDAFVEKHKRGVYISMPAEFNPKGRHVDPLEAQERSTKIAAIIGRAAK